MKEAVKITVIAAGFREVSRKQQERPSYMPKTWKAEPLPIPSGSSRKASAARSPRVVNEVIHESVVDDLDVPTFLRRQAQKA